MKTPPVLLLLGAGLALCVALMAATPWTLRVPGKLVPLREWTLVRDRSGQFVSLMNNNQTGQCEHLEILDFDRGDHLSFAQGSMMGPGSVVGAGDTLGVVVSATLAQRRIQLEGELATALAELEVYATGEKEPAVQDARLELERRRAQQNWRRQEWARLEALWRRELVSQAEVEQARSALEVGELQLQQATARLAAASTGAKDQELAWRSARVQALRRELGALQDRLAGNVVRAPLAGRRVLPGSGDTLLAIHDTAAYLVILPVPWGQRTLLDSQGTVEISAEGIEEVLVGRIVEIGEVAHMAGGHAFVAAKALVEGSSAQLGPGLVVNCALATRPGLGWFSPDRWF